MASSTGLRQLLARVGRQPCSVALQHVGRQRTPFAMGQLRFASVAQIKELRQITSAPMSDCKKALNAEGVDGDVQKAIDWLRKNGVNTATKKAGRSAAEGAVCVKLSEDGKSAVLVEINTETDFVGRNADFTKVVGRIADVALDASSAGASDEDNIASIKAAVVPGAGADGADITVEEAITDLVATFRENIVLRRIAKQEVANEGTIVSYIHNSFDATKTVGAIGSLVNLGFDKPLAGEELEAARKLGSNLAMHVVAATPLSTNVDDLNTDTLEKEVEILSEQARASGKPEHIIEKIVSGRLNKFYKENVLLEQDCMIGDDDRAVKKVVAAVGEKVGAQVTVNSFSRLRVGEGVEATSE